MPKSVGDAKLVVLDDRNRSLSIKGMVPTSGYYTILVHYHQPDNPGMLVYYKIMTLQNTLY